MRRRSQVLSKPQRFGERLSEQHLKIEVLRIYGTEDNEFNKNSEHTDMLVKQSKLEGKIEGKLDVALRMKKRGIDVTTIATITDLPFETITKL